jgi:hypothetical protein
MLIVVIVTAAIKTINMIAVIETTIATASNVPRRIIELTSVTIIIALIHEMAAL